MEIKFKINLIYDLKLKSDAIRRNIRRKTCNLSQSYARNDLISH